MKLKLFGAVSAAALVIAGAAFAEYPEKEIQGIIQWGAGGSTDAVMRAVTPHAEEVLGGKVVMQNMTGGVGAIAAKFTMTQKADGYTLLMGAENPMLYKVMGLGNFDYNSDFEPVALLARGVPILVARPDAPYNTFKELVDYMAANPEEVKFGSTGPGGLPSVVTAMLDAEVDISATFVPYDGDGPALTALQGGAIDVMPAVLGAALEAIKAERIKVIALVDSTPNEALPGIPPITEDFPGYGKYLPWGPFFGVFVKAGTPDDVVAKLSAAYLEGAQATDFVELLHNRAYLPINLSGAEAKDYMAKWQSVTSWLVYDAGIAKKSPEDFDIPRP
ncbi:tripartite-type tricarboxylate transporter receptor subunit TctC [Rhodobacter aestuarii]|uniref:Tripartite-type tricarboxylate transporter, receptor component TctC n=1 Tax=Rhodobacter aestuarii TaxID=453582 RepID=A0A1N7MNP0_9RHOB|nr:tripartite tricarboxylate transporter substrate binding protein [Rhodobacter aestuarii]PTV96649.1 tripartite-type tricarboxylate transporter receptor subunit TctC [Rhodobacter aestuarii]SIS87489.1 Tripartite-type tricarboxylate transporter, receptor component TctC [Rhodobacter aestuarii]